MYFLANIVASSVVLSNGLNSNISAVSYAFTIVELFFVIINILAILQTRYVIFIFPFIVSLYNIAYSVLLINSYNSNSITTSFEYQMSISIIVLNIMTFVYYVVVGNPIMFVIEDSFINRDHLKKVDICC